MKDITILLTIYNRREYTIKWLDFAIKLKCPFNIFICDGGNDLFLEKKIKSMIKDKKNFKYKKYKFYKNYNNFFEKFYLACKSIKSEFIYLCEDDDFLIFENIKKSGEFLKNNKDFSSSGGINFNLEIVKKNFLFIRSEFNQVSYENNNRFERIKSILNNLQSNYNCLHRSKYLKNIFKILKEKKFKNFYETELIIILMLGYYGKIKRFRHIEYIKVDNVMNSSSYNYALEFSFFKLISGPTFSSENFYILRQFKLIKKKQLKILENILVKYFEKVNRYRILNEINLRSPSYIKITYLKIKKIFQYLGLFYLLKKNYIKLRFYNSKINNLYYKNKKDIIYINKNKFYFKFLSNFLNKY